MFQFVVTFLFHFILVVVFFLNAKSHFICASSLLQNFCTQHSRRQSGLNNLVGKTKH